MVIAQRVSTLTACIRTAPTVAVVVVAVAGRHNIHHARPAIDSQTSNLSSQPRAIPHNGSMTTGTESPIVGITPDQDALRPAPRMVEMRSVGFRTCQVSEAGFASEHISAWH